MNMNTKKKHKTKALKESKLKEYLNNCSTKTADHEKRGHKETPMEKG